MNDHVDMEDYIFTPTGPLGSRTLAWQAGCRWRQEFDAEDQALAAIRDRMDSEQFWPNVWFLDDHGGLTALDTDGQPVAVCVDR